MGRTRFVKMQFDLSVPDDALTYARLKESSRRADRVSIALQAQYLLRTMMGVRIFSLEQTGLTAVPDFPAQVKTYLAIRRRAVKRIAAMVTRLEQRPAQTEPRMRSLRTTKTSSCE